MLKGLCLKGCEFGREGEVILVEGEDERKRKNCAMAEVEYGVGAGRMVVELRRRGRRRVAILYLSQ